MSLNEPGSYVTHANLPELGSGEIISSDQDTIRIRFAAGEKTFSIESVTQHLAHAAAGPRALVRPAGTSAAAKLTI